MKLLALLLSSSIMVLSSSKNLLSVVSLLGRDSIMATLIL